MPALIAAASSRAVMGRARFWFYHWTVSGFTVKDACINNVITVATQLSTAPRIPQRKCTTSDQRDALRLASVAKAHKMVVGMSQSINQIRVSVRDQRRKCASHKAIMLPLATAAQPQTIIGKRKSSTK